MVVAIFLPFVAGLESSTFLPKGNNTPQTTSNSANATVCTINAESELTLLVLNSTDGMTIRSAPVQAQFLAPECPPNPHTTATLNPVMTNSSGYVAFAGEVGEYYLTVKGVYSVIAETGPGRLTCVTLGIPNGNTTIAYSGFLESSSRFGFSPHHKALATGLKSHPQVVQPHQNRAVESDRPYNHFSCSHCLVNKGLVSESIPASHVGLETWPSPNQ